MTVIKNKVKGYYCDYPKIKGFFFVSNYMIKKYGWVEAIERTLKKL